MSLLKRNVQFLPARRLSPWRKISFGSWRFTGDSSIYTSLEFPVSKVKAYIKEKRINDHIFLMRMLSYTLEKHPTINSVIRFGKLYPRKNADIFYHVIADENVGEDLSGIVMRSPHLRPWKEINEEFYKKVKDIKKGADRSFDGVKKLFGFIPGAFSKLLLDFSSFLLYTLNLWSPLLGSPRDAFGSVMLTNIGSLGVDQAYCPTAPYTRIPMVVSAGKMKVRPFVVDNEVRAVETIILSFTYDHRIMDGLHYAQMAKTIENVFDQPELLDDL